MRKATNKLSVNTTRSSPRSGKPLAAANGLAAASPPAGPPAKRRLYSATASLNGRPVQKQKVQFSKKEAKITLHWNDNQIPSNMALLQA